MYMSFTMRNKNDKVILPDILVNDMLIHFPLLTGQVICLSVANNTFNNISAISW